MDQKNDDLFTDDLFGLSEELEREDEEKTSPETQATEEVAVPSEEPETISEPVVSEGAEVPQTQDEEREALEVEPQEAEVPLELQPLPEAETGDSLLIAPFISRAYLEYAMSVVKGRALPEVTDGQKPVQRRILYAMHEMGLKHDAKAVKSARVVGNVLGKYHPHGDSAAYEAMVRMAQNFTMRYPLVLGQGNFGSRDGDGAAAMRYTEARLSKYATLLLDEIREGTVDFVPNYDASFNEPSVLPARLPFGLLNGASGIAVGMATEIPSHNLTEVAQAARLVLENPETTLDEILAVMPGPDFATGGQIISTPEEIRDVYATGRGSVRVRARYTFEDLARGQWRLVVTQLPPNTSSQKVLSEIEDLTNPKVKVGKKVLSAEQQQTRAAMLSMLEAVRDESGKTEDVRLVFEPKSKNQDRDEFVRTLLSKTSMEGNVPVNLVFVGLDGKPRQKALTEILAEWVAFRIQTVRRRTQYRLEKALDRIHILEGRKLVFLNLEDVIALIRESDDPKVALMAKYPLSERQADDILEIRLRQLARLEGIRIEAELSELQKTREKLEGLLGNEKRLTALISREIAQDAQNYGDERRTLIEADSQTRVDKKIVDEPVTVIVSKMGYLRQRTGHGHDASIMNYRANDAFAVSFECRTTDTLVAFGSTGRVYSIPVANLPNAKGDGQYVTNFTELEPGEKILHYLQTSEDATVLIATSAGSGLVCEFKDLISKIRTGKAFIKLEKGDTVLAPQVVTSDRPLVAALSEGGRLLIFPAQDVRRLPKGGQGVTLMDLGSREKLLAIATVSEAGLTVLGTGRGGKDREERIRRAKFEKYLGNRARKGKVLEIHFKATQLTALGGSEVFDDTAEDEPQAPETNLDLL